MVQREGRDRDVPERLAVAHVYGQQGIEPAILYRKVALCSYLIRVRFR
jgi:hypothetical protein